MLDGVVRKRGAIEVAGAELAVETNCELGDAVTVGVRPEAFHLSKQDAPGSLTGAVRQVEHMGSDLYVHLDIPNVVEPVIARLLAERAPQIKTGQILHVGVQPGRALLFGMDGRRIEREHSGTACASIQELAE